MGNRSSKSPPGYSSDSEGYSPDYARKEGAAQVRIQQYLGDNAERKQQITDWHQAMDPEQGYGMGCRE
jgi:hypothetical protein